MDDGGTASGGVDAVTNRFQVRILPVNDPPAFIRGTDIELAESAASQTRVYPAWASGIQAGPPNESGQGLQFAVTPDDPSLFETGPAISPDGTLFFTPVPHAYGTTTVSVYLIDDGGIANNGVDRGPIQIFTIRIRPVNDPPQMDFIPGVNVLEDSQGTIVALTGFSPGPRENQDLTVTATSSDPLLVPDPAVTYASASQQGFGG